MNPWIMENVPGSYLDLGLYQSFWWYGLLQVFLGSCRVDTRNGYVTRPSVYQKAYSVVLVIVVGIMYGDIQFGYMERFKPNRNIYLLATGFIVLHYCLYVINLIQVRFLNNDSSVNFVIRMQLIDRCMKIDRNNTFNDILRKINDESVVLLVVAFFVFFACSLYDGTLRGVTTTMTGAIGESIIVTDLLLCSNFMEYFTIRIRFVNSIIANHLMQHDAFKLHERFFNVNTFMRKFAAKCHDFKSCDTDIYLNEIMKGFYEYQNIYRLQMLIFCCKCIVGVALYFEVVLLAIGINKLAYLNVLILGSFAVSNMILALIICLRCETFIKEVKETKNMCIALISLYVDDGPLQVKARRMLRIIEAKPPRFSVYDICHMEAAFLIRLLSVVTAIVVTLLQFAFL